MEHITEYLINVTAVYCDGRTDSMLIKRRDNNGEAACNAVSNLFRTFEKKHGVEHLTATLVGPAPSASKAP